MGDLTGKFDVEKLVVYSDDLVHCLKDGNDVNYLTQHSEQSKVFQSHCDADYNGVLNLLQDYQKKINLCKKRADASKSEAVADAEMDLLQKEDSVDERRQLLKKLEQEEQRTQMKLSMYASVSSIIPNLDDHSKTSGHIVQRDKKVVKMFEFDPLKATAFDNCDSIWKMLGLCETI
ncbi:hypothetical protein Vadar_005014 [Vaccinium darrowii]|uniref:Uncharacterized protein n=1 Tax=Vaccinium darrowii TaxID=229202 RepID=A0ACB7XWU9_9ERIC|nr:hypothetical protein Vadar_005014 [Vaccinium darrowii]